VSEPDGIVSGLTTPVLVINDGNIQRTSASSVELSMVDSLTLVLPEPGTVTLSGSTLAFLASPTSSTVNATSVIYSITNPSGDGRTWLIAFDQSSSYMDPYTPSTLADGEYTLTIPAANIDYTGTGYATSSDSYTFTREYGE
jgi:hypothetical protein